MDKTMTQVKFTIESDIVAAFKAHCASNGVSMTSEVRKSMTTCRPVKNAKNDVSTRPHRRKAVLEIIGFLNVIMDLEADYRDNIPEQFTQRYEDADHSCESLSDAIDCLEEAFQ